MITNPKAVRELLKQKVAEGFDPDWDLESAEDHDIDWQVLSVEEFAEIKATAREMSAEHALSTSHRSIPRDRTVRQHAPRR